MYVHQWSTESKLDSAFGSVRLSTAKFWKMFDQGFYNLGLKIRRFVQHEIHFGSVKDTEASVFPIIRFAPSLFDL